MERNWNTGDPVLMLNITLKNSKCNSFSITKSANYGKAYDDDLQQGAAGSPELAMSRLRASFNVAKGLLTSSDSIKDLLPTSSQHKGRRPENN